jgi:hypothetical protein
LARGALDSHARFQHDKEFAMGVFIEIGVLIVATLIFWMGWEILVGVLCACSWMRWAWKGRDRTQRMTMKKCCLLAVVFFARVWELKGHRNDGRICYRFAGESGSYEGYWRGIGDWSVEARQR